MTEILLKVPIESYRMLFYRVFLTLLVFESQRGGYIIHTPPTMAKLAETATGARVNETLVLIK